MPPLTAARVNWRFEPFKKRRISDQRTCQSHSCISRLTPSQTATLLASRSFQFKTAWRQLPLVPKASPGPRNRFRTRGLRDLVWNARNDQPCVLMSCCHHDEACATLLTLTAKLSTGDASHSGGVGRCSILSIRITALRLNHRSIVGYYSPLTLPNGRYVYVAARFEQQSVITSLGRMVYYTLPLGHLARRRYSRFRFGNISVLHGFGGGSSAYEWSKVYPAFAAEYRIVAPDLIGWGRSEHPARNYQIDDYLTTITEFLEQTCSGPVTVLLLPDCCFHHSSSDRPQFI